MRTSAVIVAAVLISAPTFTAALPTPPIDRGSEETAHYFPARIQHEHGLGHEMDQHPSPYAGYDGQSYRRPRSVRRSPLAFEHSIERYPRPRYTYSRQANRIYGREVEGEAVPAKTIVTAVKDAAKYGADALTYGTDAWQAFEAGKSLWNGTKWRREDDASGTVLLQSGGSTPLVPQGSGAISTQGVVQVGKDAVEIGKAVHDAWDAGKDAWHQIKGRPTDAGAMSSQKSLKARHDVRDGYESGKDAFEAGDDAYYQFKSRSMGSGAISAGQVVHVANDVWTIGQNAYGAYKAGKDALKQLKSRPTKRSTLGAPWAGNGALQIGEDAYDAYRAGRGEWHVGREEPRALFDLEELE